MKQETATVIFRGHPVEVVYEDHGHEPDCNAHVIEWWFSRHEMNNNVVVSDAEEQSVFDELVSISREPDGWP